MQSKIIQISAAVFVTVLIILSGALYQWNESDPAPDEDQFPEPQVFVRNGNYIIPIPEPGSSSIWSHMAILKDPEGNDVYGGPLGSFVCMDTGFPDEDITPARTRIIYHKHDLSWSVRSGDVFEVIGEENGGIAGNNYSLTLRYIHSKEPMDIFRVDLSNDAPPTSIDVDSFGVSNIYSVNRSSENSGQNISVASHHTPFSHSSMVENYGIRIGITLMNNGSDHAENITVRWYDTLIDPQSPGEDDITKELFNDTISNIQPNNSARIVFPHIFDQNGPHMIEAIVSNGNGTILTATATIDIMKAMFD